MLPVSAEFPVTPVTQYQANNPPFVPQVNILPEAQNILVHTAALVANEAGAYSGQSNPRMFCYNVLSSNNWANTAFAEVVKLACDYACLKTRSGQANSPASVILECVREALALYTSAMVVNYPDLTRYMSPDAVASASNNSVILPNLKNNIAQMYSNSGSYDPMQAHVRRPYGASNTGARVHHVTSPAVSSAVTKGIYSPKQVEQNMPQRFPSGENQAMPQVKEEVMEKKPEGITGEIEKMDREAHSIIYFGKKYEVPTSPLRRKLEEAVEMHEAASMSATPEDCEYIDYSFCVTSSLDELIQNRRTTETAVQKEGLEVYLGLGLVITPIISKIEHRDCFDRLQGCSNFTAVADALLTQLEATETVAERRATLSYISQVDRLLTRLLNDFLANKVDDARLQVTSFIEDVREIPRILNDAYSGRFNRSYLEYQRRLLGTLFKYPSKNVDDQICAIHRVDDEYCGRVFVDNFTVPYSVTFISATSQELGYTVGNDTSRVIAANTPMLSRLLVSLDTLASKATIAPSHHVIVTSDDARYMFYTIESTDKTEYALKEI